MLRIFGRNRTALQRQQDSWKFFDGKLKMMAPLSKRRKLDHDSGSELSASGSEIDSNGGSAESTEESTNDAPVTKKPRKPPTQGSNVDEDILYSAGLYKSNMFKLQVNNMLEDVRPNYEKRFHGVDKALHKLHGLIEDIEERPLLLIAEATKLLQKSKKITIPYPNPKPESDAAYKVTYVKPHKINVVGSYALKTMVKSEGVLAVDMVVLMPESIFQEKDFLNYRYFYKRAYYLACIAAGLQESLKDEVRLRYEYLNGNSLHPMLVAKPISGTAKSDSNFEIRIIPAAPETLFVESKLRPARNSVRPRQGSEQPISTPYYNASLKSDCNTEAYLKLLHVTSKQASGFKDACILGRIWLQQRGYSSTVADGGFGHFEWAAMTALLLEGGGAKGRKILSPGYSSYQMFKAVIQYLAASDLIAKPQSVETVNSSIPTSEFTVSKSVVPMFYDGTRGQNVLYKMTAWSYGQLRDEARTALRMLNEATFDQFQSVFIVRAAQPLLRYDCLINMTTSFQAGGVTPGDHRSQTAQFSSRVFEVLREGLSDRVKLITIKEPGSLSWPVKSEYPSLEDGTLKVAVVFDPANMDRLVDHGPAAEEKKKAAKFQKFWGEKAELRRFKDGSILESLIWSSGSRYSIFQEIFTYIIKRHFGPEVSQSLNFVGDGFEKLLPGSVSSIKAFDALRAAFNTFEKDLRDLDDDLPLTLRQVSPVDLQLRYSSVQPPSFSPQQPMAKPADVLIVFEGSGRWPDDLVAIQKTKIAFLLKIRSLLQEMNDTVTGRVGLENEDNQFHNCAFLDVTYPSGAAFCLRIQNEREQSLLYRIIKDKTSNYRLRENAVQALSEYKRNFVQLPLLTQLITTHGTRFPLLSPTIRLIKTWFSRHMLDQHVSDELIELLVAHVFLQPYPWRAPSSTMSGFLRTLSFLARWDWRLVPLIVDFTGEMTSAEVTAINTRLEAWRKIDPGMNRTVVFAAYNHDMSGTAFTDIGPSKLVATRMTALARSACKLVKEQEMDLNPKSLFAASTTDYNFVIHLEPKFVHSSAQKEGSKSKFKNLEVQTEAQLDIVGYNPVQNFIDEIRKIYGDAIVFFHGENSAVVGGLWNPQMVQPRPFKVNMAYATKPVKRKKDEDEAQTLVKLDKSAILAEITRLGGDMVSRIEVH